MDDRSDIWSVWSRIKCIFQWFVSPEIADIFRNNRTSTMFRNTLWIWEDDLFSLYLVESILFSVTMCQCVRVMSTEYTYLSRVDWMSGSQSTGNLTLWFKSSGWFPNNCAVPPVRFAPKWNLSGSLASSVCSESVRTESKQQIRCWYVWLHLSMNWMYTMIWTFCYVGNWWSLHVNSMWFRCDFVFQFVCSYDWIYQYADITAECVITHRSSIFHYIVWHSACSICVLRKRVEYMCLCLSCIVYVTRSGRLECGVCHCFCYVSDYDG